MLRISAGVLWLVAAGCPGSEPVDTDTDVTEETDTVDTDIVDTDIVDTDTVDTDDTDVSPDAILSNGFEAALTDTQGCTDTSLHYWNDDAHIGMSFYKGEIFPDQASEPETTVLTVGDDDFELFVEIADLISANYCSDALMIREVFNTYHAVSGEVWVTLEAPSGEEPNGTGSLYLIDVVFEDDDDHSVTVNSLVTPDITVWTAWGG